MEGIGGFIVFVAIVGAFAAWKMGYFGGKDGGEE